MDAKAIKESVKNGYGQIAARPTGGFLSHFFACCNPAEVANGVSQKIGYSEADLQSVPNGANMGIGCGNPLALARLKPGDHVLDLGSGAGFDCFLAAPLVGPTGKVTGIDLTEEMVEKARKNARKGNYSNVEFIHGDIENLPLPDNSIDVIISNCVLNLSTEKAKIFKEAWRVLKPGGALTISDVVLLRELPDFIKTSVEGYIACIAGAEKIDHYRTYALEAGFGDLTINTKTNFPVELLLTDPIAQKIVTDFNLNEAQIQQISESIISATFTAIKPQ
jgi:SAM-dependent methyltransferase